MNQQLATIERTDIRDVMNPLARDYAKKLKLFTETAGRGLKGSEIENAVQWCRHYHANPFVGDIYFFVFDAENDKRRVVPVLAIQLYRKNADRSGDYLPDEHPARFSYKADMICPENPTGIEWCEVSVRKHSHGQWHVVTERISWSERAPIRETGSEGEKWEPTGETWPAGTMRGNRDLSGKPKMRKVSQGTKIKALDPSKPNWHNMPETMMAKCVEAAAIRKAFPDVVGGSYADGELDAADSKIIELTAVEVLDEQARLTRLLKVAPGVTLTVNWPLDKVEMSQVPVAEFGDAVEKHLKSLPAEHVGSWVAINSGALREFWGHDKDRALVLRQLADELAKPKEESKGIGGAPPNPTNAPQAPRGRK
jgi:phage recombination protein Bet